MSQPSNPQYGNLHRLTDIISAGLLKKVTEYFSVLNKYKPGIKLKTGIIWSNDYMKDNAFKALCGTDGESYPYLFLKYEEADDWDAGYSGSTLSRHLFTIAQTDQANIKLKVLPEMCRVTMTLYTDDLNQARDFAALVRHAKHTGALTYIVTVGKQLKMDIRVAVLTANVQFPEQDNSPEQQNIFAVPISLAVYGYSALPFLENDLINEPRINSIVIEGHVVGNASEVTAAELEVRYPEFTITVEYED